MLLLKLIESLDEIHSCLLRILMWNYQSKVNYLCVKLRVHFRVFRKKMVLAVFGGPSFLKPKPNPNSLQYVQYVRFQIRTGNESLPVVLFVGAPSYLEEWCMMHHPMS